MPWKNILNLDCGINLRAALFTRIKDISCSLGDYVETGMGWTLRDNWSPVNNAPINWSALADGDYIIIYSAGEGGKDDLYYKIRYDTTDVYFCVYGYLYWNAATHVGVREYYSGNYSYIYFSASAITYLWIYGDLDNLHIFTKYVAAKKHVSFGRTINSIYDNTIACCTGTIPSGADNSITVDAIPPAWVVGTRLFIRSNAYLEIITIKTINPGTSTITADLINSYTNPKLAGDLGYYMGAAEYNYQYILADRLTGVGMVQGSLLGNFIVDFADPDRLKGDIIGVPYYITGDLSTAGGVYGQVKNILKVGNSMTEQVLTMNGNNYRVHIETTNNRIIAIKEV